MSTISLMAAMLVWAAHLLAIMPNGKFPFSVLISVIYNSLSQSQR
jgi:hypothetical protein